MSFWVKNNYSKLLSHLGQVDNINLKLVKFERGWFTSSALIQVTLPPTN
ncbi:YdgA family protein [Candidatus Coxiella mudrowiae]